MNLVPRTGGNAVRGSVFTSWAGEGWQGSNLSDADSGRRRSARDRQDRQELGRQRRDRRSDQAATSCGSSGPAGTPGAGTRSPGSSSTRRRQATRAGGTTTPATEQAVDDNTTKNSSIRLTWQASPRNKFGVWWDEQKTCQSCVGGGAAGSAALTVGSLSPEADGSNHNPIRMGQVDWTSPVTNRLLLEAFYGMGPNAWFGDKQRAEGYNPNLIEVQENAGPVPGIAYRGQDAQRNYGYMGTYPRVALLHHRRASIQGRRPAAAHGSVVHQRTTTTTVCGMSSRALTRGSHADESDDVREPCGAQPVRDGHVRAPSCRTCGPPGGSRCRAGCGSSASRASTRRRRSVRMCTSRRH